MTNTLSMEVSLKQFTLLGLQNYDFQYNIGCDSLYKLNLAKSAFMVGMLVGNAVFGTLADKLVRFFYFGESRNDWLHFEKFCIKI